MDEVISTVRHTVAELLMLSAVIKRRRGDAMGARLEMLGAQRANVTADVSTRKLQQVGAGTLMERRVSGRSVADQWSISGRRFELHAVAAQIDTRRSYE